VLYRPSGLRLYDDDLAAVIQPELDLFTRANPKALSNWLREGDLTLLCYGTTHRCPYLTIIC
jgi:hypothetical protein